MIPDIEEKHKKVLIMDDEEDIRDILKEELRLLGYEAEETSTGEQAIEKYKKSMEKAEPFDIIILDLTIPGNMGGKETARKIKAINKDAIIVASSGYHEENYETYDFDGILKKPYTMDELKKVLHNL